MGHAPARRSGFTLLELIIVLSVLAILAGAAVPVASKAFQSRARSSTRAELTDLADSAAEYFRDTGALPSSVMDLIADPGASGWNGPYVMMSSDDPWSGATDVTVDAWARPYRVDVLAGSVLLIESAGEDGTFGDASDIEFQLDVTPIRRDETLQLLTTVNQAITQYNGAHLPDEPLPLAYDALVAKLVTSGYLPATSPFAADGWGDAFVPTPPNKSPVVEVASIHLESSSTGEAGSGGGASGSGGEKKKDKDKKGGKSGKGSEDKGESDGKSGNKGKKNSKG